MTETVSDKQEGETRRTRNQMEDSPERQPAFARKSFYCPFCGTLTAHIWYSLLGRYDTTPLAYDLKRAFISKEKPKDITEDSTCSIQNLHISRCWTCNEIAIWNSDKLVYPIQRGGVQPNNDLPDYIKEDFEEARTVLPFSPRSAAALLRLCIQNLFEELGLKGKNLNEDIGQLVAEGLNPTVQKALDIVRVIGNNAVHPGTLDLKDDREMAERLFTLVNIIANQMITIKLDVNEFYETLPESFREQIEKRDAKQ